MVNTKGFDEDGNDDLNEEEQALLLELMGYKKERSK